MLFFDTSVKLFSTVIFANDKYFQNGLAKKLIVKTLRLYFLQFVLYIAFQWHTSY